MSLRELMESDVDDVFLDVDDFAENAVYHPLHGEPFAVVVIVNRDGDADIRDSEIARTSTAFATIWCSTSAIPNPKPGDKIVCAVPQAQDDSTETWLISGRSSRDGAGGQWINASFTERHAAGNGRKPR